MMRKFNLHEVKTRLERTKRELPVALAKQAEGYFVGSFKKGALADEKWEEVQRRIPGTNAYKYPKRTGLSRRTSPILVRTGNLRRKTSNSIRDARWGMVRLVVDLPYAQIHNEGGVINIPERKQVIHFKKGKFSKVKNATTAQKVTVKAHTVNIPARPYMKHTEDLGRKQKTLIDTKMTEIWKA